MTAALRRPFRLAFAIGVVLTLTGTTPAGAAQESGLTVAWGGDLTLGSSYGRPPARGWPQLAAVAAELRAVDLAAVNYEGTFGSGGVSKCGGSRSGNCFAFQAQAANATTLRCAGVDIVNRADNHAYDHWLHARRGDERASG